MQTESSQTGFELSLEEAQFFQSQTGITDLEELKSHILSVQEEALKVFSLIFYLFIFIQNSLILFRPMHTPAFVIFFSSGMIPMLSLPMLIQLLQIKNCKAPCI